MEQCKIYVKGSAFNVLHFFKMQTKHHFDPRLLQEEIVKRAHAERWNARYVHVDAVESDSGQKNMFSVTYAHIDALKHIFAIIQEIEDEITDAKEQVRILGLLAPEGGGACGR